MEDRVVYDHLIHSIEVVTYSLYATLPDHMQDLVIEGPKICSHIQEILDAGITVACINLGYFRVLVGGNNKWHA